MRTIRLSGAGLRLLLLAPLWLLGGLLGAASGQAETVNRIVAIVNDDIITEADVVSHVKALSDQEEDSGAVKPSPADMHAAVLRRLIEQRLILQEAKRAGVSVNEDEIAKRLEALRNRFGSREAFQRSLAESELTEEQLREKIHDELLVQGVIDAKVRSTVTISPQDVARELDAHPELVKSGDRVRAAHILIRVSEERSQEQARALIEQLHQRLLAGEDFAALAARYSEDPHREDGGEMGWVAQGELLPELDTALFGLKAGETSAPIQTRLGFHLVKVEERRPASSLSLTEANRSVYQQLSQQKFQAAFTRWLDDLRKKAYIEISGQ